MPAERGVALITIMLVVALIATLATFMAWRQQVWTRQVENLRDSAQARIVVKAGLDWARLILAQDAKDNTYDHPGESWATPVSVPVEQGRASGALEDMQGRFNLNSLIRQGGISKPDLDTYQRLLEILGLDLGLADALVDWLDEDSQESGTLGAEDTYYLAQTPPTLAANRLLSDVSELGRVRGYSDSVLAILVPHITVLPQWTAINVNAATAEVLAAAVPDLSVVEAHRLIETRGSKGDADIPHFRSRLTTPLSSGLDETRLTVVSHFFMLKISADFGRARQRYQILLRRAGQSLPTVDWMRPMY